MSAKQRKRALEVLACASVSALATAWPTPVSGANDSLTVTALPIDSDVDVVAESAAFSVEMTVMVDDGTDTCGTDTAAIVDKGTVLRFCYTLTNTGDEALNLHDVRDTHIGQVAGPGFGHLVQPGDGVAVTATGSFNVSALHGMTWDATGMESGTVVHGYDGLFVTILGPAITLDMTVMVDDGHGTCGTESEISVPVGTQVRYCYTMTDTGDEPVNYHYLNDDRLGNLLSSFDREVEPGDTLVHTESAVIAATVTSTGQWDVTSQGTGADVSAVDSVTVAIDDDTEPTTTTTTTTAVSGSEPCVATTPALATSPPTTNAPTTNPASTTSTSTSASTTTTTSTSTTTTTTPSFTTTTTGLGIVLPTTPTTLGEPAGFARRAPAGATCPETPPGGGSLPATGSRHATPAALASGLVALGSMVLITARRRRT